MVTTVGYRVIQLPQEASNHIINQTLAGTQALLAGGGLTHASSSGLSSPGSAEGPFYVMMTPNTDMIAATGSRRRSSGDSSPADLSTSGRGNRDDRRRATHNEVERRRRDKINSWIVKLAKVVPECAQDHSKHGQVCLLSLNAINWLFQEVERRHSSQNVRIYRWFGQWGQSSARNNQRPGNVRVSNILRGKIVVNPGILCRNEVQSVREELTQVSNENRRLRTILQMNGIKYDDHWAVNELWLNVPLVLGGSDQS